MLLIVSFDHLANKYHVQEPLSTYKQCTKKFGRDGPEVSALGFGLMGLSAFYGKPKPDEERYAMLDHVYKSGELFWDSADMYADSEDLIGR